MRKTSMHEFARRASGFVTGNGPPTSLYPVGVKLYSPVSPTGNKSGGDDLPATTPDPLRGRTVGL